MTDILYDSRWIGNHGIGRFANELLKSLPGITPFQVSARHRSPSIRFFSEPRSGKEGPAYSSARVITHRSGGLIPLSSPFMISITYAFRRIRILPSARTTNMLFAPHAATLHLSLPDPRIFAE